MSDKIESCAACGFVEMDERFICVSGVGAFDPRLGIKLPVRACPKCGTMKVLLP